MVGWDYILTTQKAFHYWLPLLFDLVAAWLIKGTLTGGLILF